MRTYYLNRISTKPLYEQLYEAIKKDIIDGVLKAGEKLPSKRNLSSNLGVSLITVKAAYDQLSAEGYITMIEKSGCFVSSICPVDSFVYTKEAIRNEYVYEADFDLTSNQIPKDLFPIERWSRIHRHILSDPKARFLIPSPSKGTYELRNAIRKHLKEFSNIDVDPEQIIISSGSDSIYNLLVQLLGLNRKYASEDPGYQNFRKMLANYDLPCYSLSIDKDGCKIPDDNDIDVIHTSPAHQFPTGIVMKISRRYEMLQYIRQTGGIIIEDDYDSEFRLKGNPIPSVFSISKGEKVIYMNTFSKTLSPSLKISYCVLPKDLLDLYEEKLGFYSCTVPVIDQLILEEFIESGYFSRHIAKVRNYYRKVKRMVVDELMKTENAAKIKEIREEDSGLHLLLKLKEGYCFSNAIKIRRIEDYQDSKGDDTYILNYTSLDLKRIGEIGKMIKKGDH